VTNLGYPEGALPAGGELVGALSAKDPSEHQIVHLELPIAHEPFMVALKCLLVPCIFSSRLLSLLIDQVDIFTLELVLCGFVVYLDTERAHGDLRGRTASAPYTMKKGVSPVARLGDVRLPHSAHGSSSIHFLPCFFKPS
jgi:hypothetical protein